MQAARSEALIRHQTTWLQRAHAAGLIKHEALAAALREVGVPCDRTTVTRYILGERTAPMGLLGVLLAHVDDACALLNIIGQDFGLRAVREVEEQATGRSLSEDVLDVMEATGELSARVREARHDGVISAEESRVIALACDKAAQEIAEVKAAVSSLRAVS